MSWQAPDIGSVPLLRLGVVPADGRCQGGIMQYSAAVMEALVPGGGRRTVDDVTIIRERREIRRNGITRPWPVVARWPPRHPRRLVPLLRTLLGVKAVSWVGDQLRRNRATAISLPPRDRPEIGLWYRRHGIEFIFWTVPNPLAFECGVPFVMPVHDLQHRLQPQFPEVSERGEWQMREQFYRNAARRATVLIADSSEGRDDILSCYGSLIPPERVMSLPFVPPPHVHVEDADAQIERVRRTVALPDRYLFYPAQFWPHKNHLGIVRALGLLRARGRVDIRVVFCGSHSGHIRTAAHRATMALARELGVAAQVTTLPYVEDAMITGLYLGSEGLVMPTFFGPTNIPITEAWRLRRSVITSNIRGVSNQAGDAALLVDPNSPGNLADAMLAVWDDPSLRERLVEAGRRREVAWTPQDFAARLREILIAASALARSDGGQRGRSS